LKSGALRRRRLEVAEPGGTRGALERYFELQRGAKPAREGRIFPERGGEFATTMPGVAKPVAFPHGRIPEARLEEIRRVVTEQGIDALPTVMKKYPPEVQERFRRGYRQYLDFLRTSEGQQAKLHSSYTVPVSESIPSSGEAHVARLRAMGAPEKAIRAAERRLEVQQIKPVRAPELEIGLGEAALRERVRTTAEQQLEEGLRSRVAELRANLEKMPSGKKKNQAISELRTFEKEMRAFTTESVPPKSVRRIVSPYTEAQKAHQRGTIAEALSVAQKDPSSVVLVTVRDRKLGVVRHIPVDDFVKQSGEQWEGALRWADPPTFEVEPIIKPKESATTRKALQEMMGSTEGTPGFRTFRGGKAGEDILERATGERIQYPKSVYGPPAKVGTTQLVTYVKIPTAKTRATISKLGTINDYYRRLDHFEKIFVEGNMKRVLGSGHASPKAIEAFLKGAKKTKMTPLLWTQFSAHTFANSPDKMARSKAWRPMYDMLASAVQSGKWHLPKKVLLAVAGAGALGAALTLGPSEAEAGTLETIGKGAAASVVRHKVLHPGVKRTDTDLDYALLSTDARAEIEHLDDELEKITSSKRYKFGRDMVGSIVASWLGEKWATEVIHEEFDPNIAGYVLGELPLWLLGGKVVGSIIKGPAFAAKLARSIGTGMIGRAIPETVQTLHGDQTVGEAALSTIEEGIIWGLIDLVMKPLGGAAKYMLGIGKWRPDVAITPEIVQGVERSFFNKAMAWYPEKIGAPMWEGIQRLFRAIPGFERAFVPAVKKMNTPGRRAFEDTIANMSMKADDAYALMEQAQLGLKFSEKPFAIDAYRTVEMVTKAGKNVDPATVRRGIAPIAREHGVSTDRAMQIAHNHLQPIRRAFWGEGKEAVALNLLKHKTFVDNATYIPQKYWKHIDGFDDYLKQRLEGQPFLPMPRKTRLSLNRFLRRRDLPAEVMQQLEPIQDISYLTWTGLKDVSHDVEMTKLFRKFWMMPENFAYASKKVPFGEVKRTAAPARFFEKRPYLPAGEELTIRNTDWLKENGWVKMPRIKKGDMPQFGALAGGWVPRPVAEALAELGRKPGRMEKLFSRIMSKWKFGKVVLRPATHARNMISNLILNDLGGLPFWKLNRYAEAARALKQRGNNAWFREAMENNLLQSGGYVRREIGGYWGAPDRGWVDKILGRVSGANAEKVLDVWHTARTRAAKGLRLPSKLYDVEEKLFKMGKFIDNRKKGMAAREAAEDAMKWTFNYGEITPFIRGVRTWAMPFATFSYKALPIVAETVVKHPLRFAKWPLMAMGLTYAALDKMDIKAEDWEHTKRTLNSYMKTGHYAVIPYKDAKGRMQFMDLTYILPWGDIGELSQQGMLRLMQNPMAQLLSQLSSNKNFFGQPIWYNWEEPRTKIFKVFNHIWRQAMPSWTPDLALGQDPNIVGGFDWFNLTRALRADTEEAPTMGQFALSQMGLKMRPIEPRRQRVKARRRKRARLSEARSYYSRLKKNYPSMTRKIVEERLRALEGIRRDTDNKKDWRIGKIILNPLALTPAPRR